MGIATFKILLLTSFCNFGNFDAHFIFLEQLTLTTPQCTIIPKFSTKTYILK